jgi:hypothetical protein
MDGTQTCFEIFGMAGKSAGPGTKIPAILNISKPCDDHAARRQRAKAVRAEQEHGDRGADSSQVEWRTRPAFGSLELNGMICKTTKQQAVRTCAARMRRWLSAPVPSRSLSIVSTSV